MSHIKKILNQKKIKVVDATGSLYLEVTQRDIDGATRKNPTCCAFARATERVIPGVKNVYFFRSAAWIEYEDRMIRYVLPTDVRDGVKRFDQGGRMAVGVYRLISPPKSQKLQTYRSRPSRKGHPRGKLKSKRPMAVAEPFEIRSINPKKWPAPRK